MTNRHLNLEPERALEFARSISRPRLVGSGTDELVAQEISEQLRGSGFEVSNPGFRFSTALGVALNVEILITQLLIVGALALRLTNPFTSLLLAILLLAFVPFSPAVIQAVHRNSLEIGRTNGSLFSRLCMKLGKVYRAENIVAQLSKAEGEVSLPHLILVAHYDSKSQRLPLVGRIVLFVLAILGSILFALLLILSFLSPSLLTAATIAALLALGSSIPLLFLGVGNRSPGAIDNASGVGMVIELAEKIAETPAIHNKIDLEVLITSAEELGVMGARAYVVSNADSLSQKASKAGLYVLNFEGVGVNGDLYLANGRGGDKRPGAAEFVQAIREASSELGVKLTRFNLPAALLDHLPFAEQGYAAVTLLSIGRASLYVHTRKDTVERLDSEGFAKAGEVAAGFVERLAVGGLDHAARRG